MTIRFAMNRTCAPQLTLDQFIELARGVGVRAVEIRNDVEGKEFADGTPADALKKKLDDAGLAVASVNALQRFNDWNDDRASEAESLVAYTAALGAPGIVLCPAHLETDKWDDRQAADKLREGLEKLRPILRAHGVTGYVEPLGMRPSTMKLQKMAVDAVSAIDGWADYQLCYDTFQYFRCGDTQLFPERIGLAHMSGIARPDLAPDALTEPDRGLIFLGDRVQNIRQLRELKAFGYSGYVSMEPFSPETQLDPELPSRLRASLEYVAGAVGIQL